MVGGKDGVGGKEDGYIKTLNNERPLSSRRFTDSAAICVGHFGNLDL